MFTGGLWFTIKNVENTRYVCEILYATWLVNLI